APTPQPARSTAATSGCSRPCRCPRPSAPLHRGPRGAASRSRPAAAARDRAPAARRAPARSTDRPYHGTRPMRPLTLIATLVVVLGAFAGIGFAVRSFERHQGLPYHIGVGTRYGHVNPGERDVVSGQ